MTNLYICALVVLVGCFTLVDSQDVKEGWSEWSGWLPPCTLGNCQERYSEECEWVDCAVDWQVRKCAEKNCSSATNGVWSTWGACSVTCGGGQQSRTRTCTNPTPANGGRPCTGSDTNTQECATGICPPPVHGMWTTWGSWGACPVTCGGGQQSRARTCTNPAPANGGRPCTGSATNTQECATGICPQPPVHGMWTTWGSWGACSVSCGGGQQSRARTCTNPAPANGGRPCTGSSKMSQACATGICPRCRADQEGKTVSDDCGQSCVCSRTSRDYTQCTRVRKEFTSMSTTEREEYIKTIKRAATEKGFKERYDYMIAIHKANFDRGIHTKDNFLPWHRWFLLEYENFMREVNCKFTMSYWDWSRVSDEPWRARTPKDLWHSSGGKEPSGLGGNGQASDRCVTTGPFTFSDWKIPGNSSNETVCLRREFNGNPPDTQAIDMALNLDASKFTDFELMTRVNFHDNVHCLVGGTMCGGDAASAPEFFLHHAMIDKIWADWQARDDDRKNAHFPSVESAFPTHENVLPRLYINNEALPSNTSVKYAVVSNIQARSTSAEENHSRHNFSLISDQAIQVFHVNEAEAARARELQQMIEPHVESSPGTGKKSDTELDPDN